MFKVNYIVQDKIRKIYIFYGTHKISDGVNKIDPNQLYKIEPTNPLFSNIFSKEELEKYEKNYPLGFGDPIDVSNTISNRYDL